MPNTSTDAWRSPLPLAAIIVYSLLASCLIVLIASASQLNTQSVFYGIALICIIITIAKPILGAVLSCSLVILSASTAVPSLFGVSIWNAVLLIALVVIVIKFTSSLGPAFVLVMMFTAVLMIAMVALGARPQTYATGLLLGLLSFALTRITATFFFQALGVVALAHSCVGIMESVTGFSLLYTTWKVDSAAYVAGILRAASTAADPNYFGALLVVLLPGLISLARHRNPYVAVSMVSILSLAALLTFSRTVFASVLVACLVVLIRRGGKYTGRIIIGLFAIVATVLALDAFGNGSIVARFSAFNDASISQRTFMQEATFKIAREKLLFGHGAGEISTLLEPFGNSLVPLDANGLPAFLAQTSPLNSYLLVLAEFGLVGLSLLVVVMLFTLRAAWSRPDVLFSVVAVSISGFALDLVQMSTTWIIFGLALGLGKAPGIPLDSRGSKERPPALTTGFHIQ